MERVRALENCDDFGEDELVEWRGQVWSAVSNTKMIALEFKLIREQQALGVSIVNFDKLQEFAEEVEIGTTLREAFGAAYVASITGDLISAQGLLSVQPLVPLERPLEMLGDVENIDFDGVLYEKDKGMFFVKGLYSRRGLDFESNGSLYSKYTTFRRGTVGPETEHLGKRFWLEDHTEYIFNHTSFFKDIVAAVERVELLGDHDTWIEEIFIKPLPMLNALPGSEDTSRSNAMSRSKGLPGGNSNPFPRSRAGQMSRDSTVAKNKHLPGSNPNPFPR